MEFYLPSFFLLLIAFVIIATVLPRVSPLILSVASLAAIIYVGYNHYKTFKSEYGRISISTSMQVLAPYIIIGAIFFFLSAYLLYLFKRNRSPSLPEGAGSPSAKSATNPLTYAVSNVMNFVKPVIPSSSGKSNIRPSINKSSENAELNALLSAIKRV